MLVKLANNTHVRRSASILENGSEYKMILMNWREDLKKQDKIQCGQLQNTTVCQENSPAKTQDS